VDMNDANAVVWKTHSNVIEHSTKPSHISQRAIYPGVLPSSKCGFLANFLEVSAFSVSHRASILSLLEVTVPLWHEDFKVIGINADYVLDWEVPVLTHPFEGEPFSTPHGSAGEYDPWAWLRSVSCDGKANHVVLPSLTFQCVVAVVPVVSFLRRVPTLSFNSERRREFQAARSIIFTGWLIVVIGCRDLKFQRPHSGIYLRNKPIEHRTLLDSFAKLILIHTLVVCISRATVKALPQPMDFSSHKYSKLKCLHACRRASCDKVRSDKATQSTSRPSSA